MALNSSGNLSLNNIYDEAFLFGNYSGSRSLNALLAHYRWVGLGASPNSIRDFLGAYCCSEGGIDITVNIIDVGVPGPNHQPYYSGGITVTLTVEFYNSSNEILGTLSKSQAIAFSGQHIIINPTLLNVNDGMISYVRITMTSIRLDDFGGFTGASGFNLSSSNPSITEGVKTGNLSISGGVQSSFNLTGTLSFTWNDDITF